MLLVFYAREKVIGYTHNLERGFVLFCCRVRFPRLAKAPADAIRQFETVARILWFAGLATEVVV